MHVQTKRELKVEKIDTDICVVGGGLAGICAAISAARNGANTMLVQDRPVLGGNASSEVRMWISGARGTDNKEAGILEEILLENQYRNPGLKYTIWDHILYSKVKFQPNLRLLLNTSVITTKARENQIQSLCAWQLTTQKWIKIKASYYIDCSGDSILRYCGAHFFRGREGKNAFNESYAVNSPDDSTMGNSILIQLRETDQHVPFIPPKWAYLFTEQDLPYRILKAQASSNFWWLEVGGLQDTLADSESIRDELLKIAYGAWACIKNHPDGRGHGWELEWIGSVPGKRENIRYQGAWVLDQNDITSGGKFKDIVAYGGWPMDDHHPAGIHYKGRPTVFNKTPSPYGIPLRCLYSGNITNLFFAGRNISATHIALGSTRVMGTCAMMGQAAGTAAALTNEWAIHPHKLEPTHIKQIQTRLLDQDCFLPGLKRRHPDAMPVTIEQDARAVLSNGIDRTLNGEDNGLYLKINQRLDIKLHSAAKVKGIRLIHDSDFTHIKRLPCSYPLKANKSVMPAQMMRSYLIEYFCDSTQSWKALARTSNNTLRLDRQNWCPVKTSHLKLTLLKTWGKDTAHLFALDVV